MSHNIVSIKYVTVVNQQTIINNVVKQSVQLLRLYYNRSLLTIL